MHDKEVFAIVDSFRTCRECLVGVEVKIHTDYQGLLSFNTKLKLNSRQASRYLYKSQFRYNIYYRPRT